MARVYTERLLVGVVNTDVHTFTVPQGVRAVVRDIVGYANAGVTSPGTYYVINQDQSTIYDYWKVDVDTTVFHHLELRQVVEPGERLVVYGAGPQMPFAVTGYLLTLP